MAAAECPVCEVTFKTSHSFKSVCSDACRVQHKRNHQVNYRSKPEYIDVKWESTLKRKYGITPDDYTIMLIEQGGLCAICRQPEVRGIRGRSFSVLCVDHDHKTGKVRGLLCHGCNHGIGSMRDDPAVLRAAANYVETANG